MGQRSAGQTLAAIYVAFTRKRDWTQAELAREIGISSKTLGKRLAELEALGMGIEKDADPPHVYWSVPKGWLPGALALTKEQVGEALRLLSRLPRTRRRDALLGMLARAVPAPERPVRDPADQAQRDELLSQVEDAARSLAVLHFRYRSASSGADRLRRASVHRVVHGPRARFVAFCHEKQALRWFRVDRVQSARIDPAARFHEVEPDAVDAFVAGSVDGFHRGEPVACSFVLLRRDMAWVQDTLPVSMRVESTAEGLRFEAITAGVEPLARFVVGLGDGARVETPELALRVKELALGALGQEPARARPLRSTKPRRAQAALLKRGR